MQALARLGIGTAQWGMDYGISNELGQTPFNEVESILQQAKKNEIYTLDTAYAYGDSEVTIGNCTLADEKYQIITKTAPIQSDSIGKVECENTLSSFNESLTRLKRKSVYGLLIHSASNLLAAGGEKLWDVLEGLKTAGKVSKLGVSVYEPEQLTSIIECYPVELVQLPCNIYDQRFIRTGVIERLKNMGIEVHARSAFLQGLLLLSPEKLPGYFADIVSHHRNLYKTFTELGVSPVAGCLDFCFSQEGINRVIVGVSSRTQFSEVINSVLDTKGFHNQLTPFMLDDLTVIEPNRWSI